MRNYLKILVLIFVFAVGVLPVSAGENKPVVVMGNVTYGSIGTNQLEGGPASFYGSFLKGNLINSGGVSMMAQGEEMEMVLQLREEYNQLNGGQGSYYEGTDAQGNKFWGYGKLDGNILVPQFRIDAHIDVIRARHSENASLQDVSVAVRIYDIATGKLFAQTTEVKRNVNPYANLQELGPKPTWVEKYLTGYAREIKYDDPIREAIDKASKQVLDKFSGLSGQKAESDTDRFSKFMQERDQNQANDSDEAQPEESSGGLPAPGTAISKNDYSDVIDEPGCDPWAVYPETGVYCFTEAEMNAIGASGDLGQIRNQAPTYPFYDGNEPWQTPLDDPAEAQTDEEVEYESEAPTYVPQESGSSDSGELWTVPR